MAFIPRDLAVSTAGNISEASSSPINPPSLPWGFRAAVPILGFLNP